MRAIKVLVLAGGILAGFALAFEIDRRVTDETTMLFAGIACGLMASVPVGIGIVLALVRTQPTPAPRTGAPVTFTTINAPPSHAAEWEIINPRPAPPVTVKQIGAPQP